MPSSAAPRQTRYDAVVIGSGPNGLAAAITLAREGLGVLVVEAKESIGGGTRTAELTLPGFHHDVCSAVHPMALASPFMRGLHLEKFGLDWVHPETVLAHPLDGGRGAAMKLPLGETAALLPDGDGAAWRRLVLPHVRNAGRLWHDLLAPLTTLPRHPLAVARFGWRAMRSARGLARSCFSTEEGRALLAGNAAHSVLPLERSFTAAVGLTLAVAGHSTGWPVARGGSASITRAMARYFEAMGGEVICGWRVEDLAELPAAAAYLFDTGPHQLADIAGARLPDRYRAALRRYRYGPGVFKLDLALSEAVPWQYPHCRTAGTVHAGGTLDEISESERACWEGRHAARPFVLIAQQSLCDETRAPHGKHTLWAYCHVPHDSTQDMTGPVLQQIERFAPGFRDTILAVHATGPGALAEYNPNNVGGDVIGGVMDLRQIFARPVARWNPYSTPARDIYICSSATPPGGGVHGMCGWHAARTVLRRLR